MSNFANFNMDFNAYQNEVSELATQKKDQPKKKEYKDPVDGNYTCELVSLEMGTNKAGDKLMLKGSFRIVEGEFKNCRLWINKMLAGTKNDAVCVKMAVDFLNGLGAVHQVEFTGDFDDLSKQIEIVVADIQNCQFEVTQKTTDSGFKNLYVNDVFDC